MPLSAAATRRRDGSRLGLWADQRGGWLVRDLACIPSRHTITYCDHAPEESGSAFQPPGEVRLGAAATGSPAGGVPADAALLSARFYSYALPDGELAAEAAADSQRILQHFRLLPVEGRTGEPRVLVACPPFGDDVGSTGGGGGGGGLPIAILGAAAGGGAAAIAVSVGLSFWWCRRRQRLSLEAHEEASRARADALSSISADSASSFKSVPAAKLDTAAGGWSV